MFSNLRKFLLGNPLPNAQEIHERLTKVKALAVFSSDALSSAAYGTEEVVLALAVAGTSVLTLTFPIAAAIVILLAIVTASYYQTVHGYPSGGGSYIVAHDNLGRLPGLIAGSSLLIDYVLTVAVSIAAGMAAITSAFPSLLPYTVHLCLASIIFIAWANLRGVRESGSIFSLPTYSFIFIFLTLIITGLVRLATGTITPYAPHVTNGIIEGVSGPLQPFTLYLILRAFAGGCSTLTGVEAISNGIPAFYKPESRNAGITLIWMAVILGVMTLGISFLAVHLHVETLGTETIASQLGRKIFGTFLFGIPYMILQFATALILVVAANTSFADFPRLSSILARDGYFPRQMSNRGDRLVFSNGIIILALLSIILVVLFKGDTHRLIPLYAVGVFLSFTLSQAGMVRHWQKEKGKGWILKACINGLGAIVTFIVLVDIIMSKFMHGAWIVTLLIPVIVFICYAIKNHYVTFAEELSLDGKEPELWSDLDKENRKKVIIPVSWIHKGTITALHFARSMTKDVTAVVIDLDPRATAKIQEVWKKWGHDVPLVVIESPYRSIVEPLMKYVEEVDHRDAQRGPAVIIVPEFVPAKWWHHLLHNQTAILIKALLTYSKGTNGNGHRVIIDVPFHLSR
ncbi:MAG: APC family permease [Candidatus Eremiobacterota bacterium]